MHDNERGEVKKRTVTTDSFILNVANVIARGFPPDEGRYLADWWLAHYSHSPNGVRFSLEGVPASMLIGGFFFAFLQRLHDQKPKWLPAARTITWVTRFEFQRENIERWVRDFKPAPPI